MGEEVKKRWGCFKVGLIVILVSVLLLAGIVGGLYLWGNYRIDKAERTVSEYLQKKYNREFVVTNGHYIWATGTYTFDAYAKDDPELKFPAFAGFRLYENGIGDMYFLNWRGREAHKMLDPYVNAISKNNVYGAMYGAGVPSGSQEWETIMAGIYDNNLNPLQAAAKYPRKIYLNTSVSFALDVTEENKEEIFKKVFTLIDFLKKSGFGDVSVVIYFYPSNVLNGKIIKDVYKNNPEEFENDHWKERIFSIGSGENIHTWEDLKKYSNRRENGRWVNDYNNSQASNKPN